MQLSLNYLFEANLALCLFVAMYQFLFRKDTNFAFKRVVLLSGIAISVIFPVFHVDAFPLESIPTIREVLPSMVLPELVVVGYGDAHTTSGLPLSTISTILYALGMTVALAIFLLRVIRLIRKMATYRGSLNGTLYVVESPANEASFSFFNFIFLGQCNTLTEREKEHIIAHEAVHARQFHSFDILLLNIIGIFFWFNPVIRYYKDIFIQLHEFEADARSVKDEEMNEYCSLLARVALLSADIRIANHFSNSLTLKRIQMMRTNKMKTRLWKVATMCMLIPAFFLVLSCQDQLMNEVTDIAKSSSVALDVPPDVQQQFDEMRSAHPDKKFLLVEVDANGQAKVQSLKEKMDALPPESISSVNVIKHPATQKDPERGFIIVEYNEELKQIQESSKTGDVYTVVEETASPVDGMEKYFRALGTNISYPIKARLAGEEGKVFVSFIIEKDGTLSDLKVEKGVSEELNAEALRVIPISGKWTPARNNGETVRQRLVLPINFRLGDQPKKEESANEG